MGNFVTRNRFWWFRSMYDEYTLREFRISLLIGSVIWLPGYFWGIHINREVEVNEAHHNYFDSHLPLRNRLTHSLLFEQFEMHLENWKKFPLP
jgi:hypothetical protein